MAGHRTPPSVPAEEILNRAEQLDGLDAILPFDRRDQLAVLLTDDDVATLKHLAKEGTGANTLRALASDLAYLEAWCALATGTPSLACPEALYAIAASPIVGANSTGGLPSAVGR